MSKVQFNLLPDVKLEYIKTERTRKLVTSVSVIVSAVSLGIFLLMFLTVNVVQKQQLSSAQAEVEKASKQLEEMEDLGQVLTIHNQLTTLSGLHENKHVSSRIFNYLPQVTPTSVDISSLTIDFNTNAMTISGSANNHQSVNQFIDTLKFTTFKISSEEGDHPAFPSVIESSFGINNGNATYSLNIQFDPKLFSNSLKDSEGRPEIPKLSVPKLTTTRSLLEITSNPLFEAQINTPPTGAQQ